jgi:hypothetical protein
MNWFIGFFSLDFDFMRLANLMTAASDPSGPSNSSWG